MASHFTVIYDACVLYPAPLRDLLMHLALTDLQAAARHRQSMKKPPRCTNDYLDTLAAQGLTHTVRTLRPLAIAL